MSPKEQVNQILKSLEDRLSPMPFKETYFGTAKLNRDLLKEDCSENSSRCTVFKTKYFVLRMIKARSIKLDWYTAEDKSKIHT